ncbi:MAG: dimethyl sulfoxide reductase anchor subunit [Slackia sp.]|nr:dimethyl sulfoxide reductase anchor subunit [Slackia sp.]
MGAGFSGGSLAVFTALAPAGAVAFALMAAFVSFRRAVPRDRRDAMNHALIVPLGVTWAGFIASATHLGTPANALHAVAGVGRSPLSNEVVAVVSFLFFAGIYWLYSYRIAPSRRIAGALAAASVVSCIGMVALMTLAYSVATVPSWNSWHTPANLALSALVGGCSLAMALARAFSPDAAPLLAAVRRVLPISIVATAASLASHAAFLAGVTNNVACAADAVPSYGLFIGVFAIAALAGWAMQRASARFAGWKATAFDGLGCALVLCAVLLARVPFYGSYLSAGF